MIARLLSVVLVLTMAAAAVPAAAQQAYVLGPGDVVEISVFGYADLTRLTVILPEGTIMLPLVGTVRAAGLTVDELARALTRAYARFVKNPQVIVTIREFRKVVVSVLGQVAQPGSYTLVPGARLLDAISAAGGLNEAADPAAVQILRPGQAPVSVDVGQALAGHVEANPILMGGETIVIKEDLVNLITVTGEVSNPGRYRLRGDMRVLDALALAGGLRGRASLAGARLLRRGVSEPLNLDRLLLRQDMTLNIPLQAGDTILIPPDTEDRFYVLGDVRAPGMYPLKGDVTLLQGLAMAGGPTNRGLSSARTVHLIRRGTDETARPMPGVQVERMGNGALVYTMEISALESGARPGAMPVQAGDVIVVPESGQLNAVQLIISILLGLRKLLGY